MAALAINHYNLRASKGMMAVLRDFYCHYVGLVVGPRPPLASFGYWLYAGDQAVLHLSEIRPGESRQTEHKTTFDHVAFSCSDQTAMLAILDQGGITYRQSTVPSSEQFASQSQIFFSDPAGNGIELNFEDTCR